MLYLVSDTGTELPADIVCCRWQCQIDTITLAEGGGGGVRREEEGDTTLKIYSSSQVPVYFMSALRRHPRTVMVM